MFAYSVTMPIFTCIWSLGSVHFRLLLIRLAGDTSNRS